MYYVFLWAYKCSIVGSVVECSPATRAARVRFPDDANFFLKFGKHKVEEKVLEAPGIDPGTSRMLSERSTIWATPPP